MNNEGDTLVHIEQLQDLAINEMVEVVVPLCYLLCFASAYFGPNAELIGDIKNSYWHYSAVADDDVLRSISYVVMFFVVDVCSLVVSAYLLWTFCKISLYKACTAVQQEFGGVFSFTLAAALSGVIAFLSMFSWSKNSI